jgi:hypothetical protein
MQCGPGRDHDWVGAITDGGKPASKSGNGLVEPPLGLQFLPQRELLYHGRRNHLVVGEGSGGVAGGHGRFSR